MADSDTVAKFRRSVATRIEWTLRTNQPEQRLRKATEAVGGRTLLRNVPAANRPSPLSKPRVLREAACELAALERSAGATYADVLARLKGRYGRTTLGSVFASADLGDWANVPKSDVRPVLAAFWDGCASLALKKGVRRSAEKVHEFLTSTTGRQISDLGHLRDVDLDDWETDHGVLRNVLRQLGNPADWIQTWLDAGTPSNVVSRHEYTNSYSVLALNAVKAARNYPKNLWASRRQWEGMGCQVLDEERGSPVFHYFSRPNRDEERDVVGVGGRSRQGPLRRVSFVFNVGQIRRVGGRPFRLAKLVERRGDVDACVSRHGVRIFHRGVEYPFYDVGRDEITMPPRTWFRSPAGREQATFDYYATLLHELVHWTGHATRLARPFGYSGDERYRFEELVAELGSGFLCARFGLGSARRVTSGRQGVAAYINDYFEQGRDAVDLVIDAAGEANRASNYLIYAKLGES